MGDREARGDRARRLPALSIPTPPNPSGLAGILAVYITFLLYALAPLAVITVLGARLRGLIPFWVVGVIALSMMVVNTTLNLLIGIPKGLPNPEPSYSYSPREHPRQAVLRSLFGVTSILAFAFGFYVMLHWAATSLPLAVQGYVFLAFAGGLLYFAQILSTERGQQSMLELWSWGVSPYIYLGALTGIVAVLTSLFASISFVLQRHEVIHLFAASGTDLTVDTIMTFYLWHFLDGLPLLEVTKTLHWAMPMKNYDTAAGMLLIGYKIAVIIPLVALFVQMTKAIRRSSQ